MKKYFIEQKKRTIVDHPLFKQVEKWDVVEKVEYPTENEWKVAMESIGIPDVCWLTRGDISWTACVEGHDASLLTDDKAYTITGWA